MRSLAVVVVLAALAVGCHPGPVVDTHPEASVGGTIAGIVGTADKSVAIVGRKVTVTDVASGKQFAATTGANGGYTIKVPEGTYRIEVELRSGEALAKRPDETHINNGDLDPHRDFTITAAPRDR
jgi:hypothetical protein